MLDTRCLYYNQPAGWRDAIGGCLKCDGTVCHVARGGNGCYAVHSADTVPVLWLYRAEVELASLRGRRRLQVSELYDGEDGRRWLNTEPDEVLIRVRVPIAGPPVIHHKVRLRGSIDYGAILVAVAVTGAGGRAVIGATGPAPVEVTGESLEDLPDLAYRAVRPLRTHTMAPAWRKHMVRVAVRRALTRCHG